MIGRLFDRLRRSGKAGDHASSVDPRDSAARAQAAMAGGNAALGRGELTEAARCYREAIAAQPQDPFPRLNLGFVLLEAGAASDAADVLEQAIALRRPSQGFLHEALFLRGRAQHAMGRSDDALTSYRAALEAQPSFEEPLLEIVPLLIEKRRPEEALALAKGAGAAMASSTPRLLAARALHALGSIEQALGMVDEVLAREPGHLGAVDIRANLLLELDQADRAVPLYQRLLAAEGPQPARVANLGAALLQVERPEEALRVMHEAARQHPDHPELQLNHALAQLAVGDLPAGWQGFEWRWQAWIGKAAPWEQWPRWRGEDLANRSIMLVCEQGMGDSIQCLRYVPLVAARAREVVLVLQRPLVPVAAGLAPNCRVVALEDTIPRADCQCPLMSLPGVFRTSLETVPATVPYLHVDAQKVERWRARLPGGPGPRIGLTWSGGPKPMNRSVPLALLAALAREPCRFVSLQPEVREQDRTAMAAWPGLYDAGPSLQDFSDTAALLQCLDLVITVDTSVAHLAGALGRPVWVMLRFAPDWRWMTGRNDTPWYPSMRLYRQETLGDWHPVVARVQRDLQSFEAPRQ